MTSAKYETALRESIIGKKKTKETCKTWLHSQINLKERMQFSDSTEAIYKNLTMLNRFLESPLKINNASSPLSG